MIPDSVLESTPGLVLSSEPCDTCQGDAYLIDHYGTAHECPECSGRGEVEVYRLEPTEWIRGSASVLLEVV